MKKTIILVLTALLLTGLVTFSTIKAYADDNTNLYPSIVQKIADKFGLNQDEVKTVFDQNRQEHQTQMQAKFEDRLSQAVSNGKITEAQKALILAKHQEMQTQREQERANWQNLTPEERKSKMEAKREDLKTWASQNGIDIQYLMQGMGMRGGRGFCNR